MNFGPGLALIAATLTACAVVPAAQQRMQPFTTDGCSLFPDRALIGHADWRACCVAHDHAYWRGGSELARLSADRELRACVHRATGNEALAELMYVGVRTGGGPYYFTSYRWAYGWPYGRGYAPLSADEQALADRLERESTAAAAEPFPGESGQSGSNPRKAP